VATLLVTTLLLFACTKDDGSSSSPAGGDDGASVEGVELDTAEEDAPADEPPATELGEVQPIVVGLLERYDEITDDIVADPELARDRDADLVREFLDLFEPGSEFAEASLDAWEERADTGVVLEPLTDGTLVNATTIDGLLTPVSEDEVRFVQCALQNYVMYDDGEQVQRIEDKVLAGEGTAVRVDGRWRLGTLTTPEGMLGCGIER